MEEWDHFWWTWAGDTAKEPPMLHTDPKTRRLKPGQYVHRFGIQPRPVRVPAKPRIKPKAPRA